MPVATGGVTNPDALPRNTKIDEVCGYDSPDGRDAVSTSAYPSPSKSVLAVPPFIVARKLHVALGVAEVAAPLRAKARQK